MIESKDLIPGLTKFNLNKKALLKYKKTGSYYTETMTSSDVDYVLLQRVELDGKILIGTIFNKDGTTARDNWSYRNGSQDYYDVELYYSYNIDNIVKNLEELEQMLLKKQ